MVVASDMSKGCQRRVDLVRTREDVFVDACQLDIRLWGVGDNEAVHDAFGDGHGDGMSEEALYLDARRILLVLTVLRRVAVENIDEGGLTDDIQRYRR